MESRDAHMLVVGAFGAGYPTRKPIGSTPKALVRSARCPLAVIRTPQVLRPEDGVIAVAECSRQCDTLLRMAMDEARLRKLQLLTLSPRAFLPGDAGTEQFRQSLDRWRGRYPEVEVDTVAIGTSPAGFLTETDRTVRLVITDGDERTHFALPAGGGSTLFHAYCAVLFV